MNSKNIADALLFFCGFLIVLVIAIGSGIQIGEKIYSSDNQTATKGDIKALKNLIIERTSQHD